MLLRDASDPTTAEEDASATAAPSGQTSTQGGQTRTQGGQTPTQGDGTMTAGTAAAPPTTPGGGSAAPIADRDLDEMVRRLYPRLRRSLSSELLVARERAGTLADLH
jgi:hypothetical protein